MPLAFRQLLVNTLAFLMASLAETVSMPWMTDGSRLVEVQRRL